MTTTKAKKVVKHTPGVKSTTVTAACCKKCRVWVYSRARHDFNSCPCGGVSVDGGRDYLKLSFDAGTVQPQVKQFVIQATNKELFDDWTHGAYKFGLIHDNIAGRSTLVYLAVPYTHKSRAVQEARFHAVNRAAAKLMLAGFHIFSPISHTHSIALDSKLPTGYEFWMEYDTAILSMCGKLIVLMLDGWKVSVGVKDEIKQATKLGIPVEYLPGSYAQ